MGDAVFTETLWEDDGVWEGRGEDVADVVGGGIERVL